MNKTDEIEINEDLDFEKRFWIIQRVGWAVLILIILLALLGFFGDGVLSNAKAGQENAGVWLDYPQFARYKNQFRIAVHVETAAINENEIPIRLNRSYLDRARVDGISPAPDNERSSYEWITYLFTRQQEDSSLTVYFYVTPFRAGVLPGMLQSPDGRPVNFSQFVFP